MASPTPVVGSTPGLSASCGEGLMFLIVAMVILRLEPQRYAGSAKRILRQYAPEVAGLTACLLLAAALRARGDVSGNDTEAWVEITKQWPILLTADTLLSFQAMLRLVILLSAVLRAGAGPMPLSGLPAVLFLCAGLARVATSAASNSYALDGPLGGLLPVACEVASLPLLLALSRGSPCIKAPATAVTVAAAAVFFAGRNRLNLGEDGPADSFFAAAHCFDTLAAFAYLLRTVLLDTARRTDVSHILMPIQQALSAYYFVQAFSPVEGLVGAGQPFEMLQIGALAQLGAFLGAAALHIAEGFEGREASQR